MPFPAFDRNRLKIQPLAARVNDLDLKSVMSLDSARLPFAHSAVPQVASAICSSYKMRQAHQATPDASTMAQRTADPATILMMGAHVIRAGVSRFIIDLMERGIVTQVAMNGAGPIHDWEFAQIGATTESVARYIRSGEFGLWRETGRMNDAISSGARDGIGMGEALGREIAAGRPRDFPNQELSILAAGYRLHVPVTVHIGIGYDIIHEHPNADGAALGATSYQDFLIFTESVAHLESGVMLCFGSSVMGPEVYLKALAMARNVAHQRGNRIADFTTAVFDLIALPDETHREAPKTNPQYYFRPWKTILARTVADGGVSHYIQGDHRQTVPALYDAILSQPC